MAKRNIVECFLTEALPSAASAPSMMVPYVDPEAGFTPPSVESPRPSGTLKQRDRQMSLYLEPATYDALRDLAHHRRTKMHSLLLLAVDRFLKEGERQP